MRLISLRNRIRSGCLTVLATAAVVALAAPGSAQTVPPTPASAAPSADLAPARSADLAPARSADLAPARSADLAKVHLTAARNALSDVTQLPAAAQLTGETRTRVQQLITSFNELIGKTDWRGPYAKVEANLSTLLGSETPAPATVTPGAVGTSGAAAGLDPAIRAKLVEFRTHLDMFKTVASAAAPETAAPPAATAPPPAAAPPTPTPAPTPAPATTTPPATRAAARDDAARADSAHSSTHAATDGRTSGLARPETRRAAVTGSRRQRRWAGRFRCGPRSASSRGGP